MVFSSTMHEFYCGGHAKSSNSLIASDYITAVILSQVYSVIACRGNCDGLDLSEEPNSIKDAALPGL